MRFAVDANSIVDSNKASIFREARELLNKNK